MVSSWFIVVYKMNCVEECGCVWVVNVWDKFKFVIVYVLGGIEIFG